MNAILVVAGIMISDGLIFAAQRNEKAHQALKWEFPGGKVEEGETPEKALERELFEELGIQTRTGRLFSEKRMSTRKKRSRCFFTLRKLRRASRERLKPIRSAGFQKKRLCALTFPARTGLWQKRLKSVCNLEDADDN